MTDWRLDPVGTFPWTDLAQHVPDGLTWCWIDLDGLAVGQPPVLAPIGTHVWGWSDNTWVRGRIERGLIRTAILHYTSTNIGEPVSVSCERGLPWQDNERRLSNAGHNTMQRLGGLGSPHILTAGVVAPITFLDYGATSPGERG